jgi:hypothetical protein
VPYWRQRTYGDLPGEIGREATPQEYVQNIVAVGREVRRILKDDGVFFLNVGDKAAVSGRGGGGALHV